MSIKTQGTNLYAIDPDTDVLIVVGCVTAISGITASRDEIETTCLEDQARSYESGMLTPGSASFAVNFDPANATHIRLHELYVSGQTFDFALGFSDGTAAPTVDSNGDFVLPNTRSWIVFTGYITEIPFDFALSTVVNTTIGVKVSGLPVMTPRV